MYYRLLAMSIDGTLLKSNGKLDRATKDAIQYVKDKGVYVTLVTSRNFSSAKKVAKALKLDSYLVTHSGAFMARSVDKPFYEQRIPEEQTIQMVELLEQRKCTVRVVHERFSLGNRFRNRGNLIARAAFSTADPIFYPMQFVEMLSDTLRQNPVAPPNIEVYVGNQAEADAIKGELYSAFSGIDIIDDRDGKLDILPANNSKRKGLQMLGEQLGISLREMVFIGDSYRDKELIEQTGLGVAMWNAPADVKLAADWITRSNDQQGVSYMVKEHFRKQLRVKMIKSY